MRAAVVLIALALGAIHGTAAQAPGAGGAAAPRAETARETSLTPEQLKAAIDRLGTVDYAARMTAARALRRAPVAMVAPAPAHTSPLWSLWSRVRQFKQGPSIPLQPTQRADKCDLCNGYDDLACVSACPTGALRLMPVEELFSF